MATAGLGGEVTQLRAWRRAPPLAAIEGSSDLPPMSSPRAYGKLSSSTATGAKGMVDSNRREAVHEAVETRVLGMVELGGLEPPASSMPLKRSPR